MSTAQAWAFDRAEDSMARARFPSIWKLLLPYWKTKDGLLSLIMLMYVLCAGWGGTYISLWINRWTGTFYDAVGSGKFQSVPQLLVSFLLVAVISAAFVMSSVLLQGLVEIRWRKWLTLHVVEEWLARNTYYRIERDKSLENVDQRIAEDVKLFVKDTLHLTLGLLQVPVSVVAFSVVLWNMGGPLIFRFNGATYSIQGFLVIAAFLYQALIFAGTHLLGRRLITLNAKQNRVEGDYRVLMVRIREFSEQIAFFQGEGAEDRRLGRAFRHVVDNLYAVLRVSMRVALFTNIVGQVTSIIPTLLVLPQLMSGSLTLGGLMRSNQAFHSVISSLAFFPQVYPGFAAWRAEGNRLREFLYVKDLEVSSGIIIEQSKPGTVSAKGLVLSNDAADTIAHVPDFELAAGARCLVRGRSGCGKSTLLRALAGLWPYGAGRIARSDEGVMFLPQRSFIPPGTLKAAITYPADEGAHAEGLCAEVLQACGLGAYVGSLGEFDQWGARLSGGEQQRVAFARVLLANPSIVFLDESTSALDSDSEQELYQLLIDRLPNATLVSIAHRKELARFHNTSIDFPPKAASASGSQSGAISSGALPA